MSLEALYITLPIGNSAIPPDKTSIIPIPVELSQKKENFRNKFGIGKEAIVCGYHQKNDEAIFSKIPLEALSEIIKDNVFFIILDGAKKNNLQANKLDLKHVHFVEHIEDGKTISKFLNTLQIHFYVFEF